MDHLEPNTIIGLVLALFAVLGFLKNFVKFFFNLISLGIGALAGIWGYNNGFSLASMVTAEPADWMPAAVGVVAFIGAVCFVRGILGFLSGKSGDGSQAKTGGFGLPGGVFGLLIGGGIAYFMLTGVRYAGTMSELARVKEYVSGKLEENADEPVFIKLKDWIDKSVIGQWHQKIDFLNDPAEANLAKLAILKKDANNIGTVTANPDQEVILEALPVDPSLEESIARGDYSAVLRQARSFQSKQAEEEKEKLSRMDIERLLGIRK